MKAGRTMALVAASAGAGLQDRAGVCGSSGRPPEQLWF